jgi:hypothetical protein
MISIPEFAANNSGRTFVKRLLLFARTNGENRCASSDAASGSATKVFSGFDSKSGGISSSAIVAQNADSNRTCIVGSDALRLGKVGRDQFEVMLPLELEGIERRIQVRQQWARRRSAELSEVRLTRGACDRRNNIRLGVKETEKRAATDTNLSLAAAIVVRAEHFCESLSRIPTIWRHELDVKKTSERFVRRESNSPSCALMIPQETRNARRRMFGRNHLSGRTDPILRTF